MARVRITQVKSKIERPEKQKRTLEALGLKKINQTVELEATPQILGMGIRRRSSFLSGL